MADGKVRIKVEDNARQSARNFDKLDKELKDVTRSAGSADKSFITLKSALVGLGGVLAVRQVLSYSNAWIKAASDAEETANKFNVVFQDVREEATQTAEAIAKGFGLSSRASQQFLSDTGDLLTGLGFAGDEALAVSSAVTKLAVDLASFTNVEGGATRASQALTSALLGEREAVKSLGIAIGEADIKRLAEEKGIVGELTRQQKALLTLEIATKQSKNAIGDFARSQDSYANRVRVFESAIEDLSVKMGTELLPIATQLFEDLTELLNDPEFVDGITSFATGIGKGATALLNLASAFGSVKKKTDEFIESGIPSIFGEEFEKAVKDARELEKIQDSVNKQISKLGATGSTGNVFVDLKKEYENLNKTTEEDVQGESTVAKKVDELREVIKAVNDATTEAVKEVDEKNDVIVDDTGDRIKALGDSLSSVFVDAFNDGENSARNFGISVLNIIGGIARKIAQEKLSGLFASFFTPSLPPGVGPTGPVPLPNAKGNAFENGNVKAFAKGGVVNSPTFFPMAGGNTGLMGEAGAEAIMPLKRGKGGRLGVEAQNASPTINVINNSQAQIETVQRPNNEFDIIVREVTAVLSSQRSDNAVSSALSRQRQNGIQGA